MDAVVKAVDLLGNAGALELDVELLLEEMVSIGGSGCTVVDEETALGLRSSGAFTATGNAEGSSSLEFLGEKQVDGSIR